MRTFYHSTSYRIYILFLTIATAASLVSCKKYLDAKPDQSIATPATLSDAEGILDNYLAINGQFPTASEVGSDNFYLTDADFKIINDRQRNLYIWQKFDDIGADYVGAYTSIEYANVVLETLDKSSNVDLDKKRQAVGYALFIRGASHFALAQLFAKPFNEATANEDLGIVIRRTADVAAKPVRAKIAETYQFILDDLVHSTRLLPSVSNVKYRPGKAAAYGVIARVYLSMRNYKQAEIYTDSSLSINNKLIDYNLLNANATNPIVQFIDEVLWDARTGAPQALALARAKVDTALFTQYASNDLRRTVYFKTNTNGSHAFKASYSGQTNGAIFTGIATDEVYLIKAECAVRNGSLQAGLEKYNSLLVNRFKTGTYEALVTTDAKEALHTILGERRKELLYRGLRWTDLRRLNFEPEYAQKLERRVDGRTYTLDPGSPRYVLQIDKRAVQISGLEQNP